jgi:hypothetical protein
LRTPSTVLLLIPERSALSASDYIGPFLSRCRRRLLNRNRWGFGRRRLRRVVIVMVPFRYLLGSILRVVHVRRSFAALSASLAARDVHGLQASCQPSNISINRR